VPFVHSGLLGIQATQRENSEVESALPADFSRMINSPDSTLPPMPAKVTAEQALHFAESLARGEPNRRKIVITAVSDKIRELI